MIINHNNKVIITYVNDNVIIIMRVKSRSIFLDSMNYSPQKIWHGYEKLFGK